MMRRKIQECIHEYLVSGSNKVLVIDGARQDTDQKNVSFGF